MRNRIIVTAQILPFLKISTESTRGRVLHLVKLHTDCSDSDFILKWLHQECFPGSLPKAYRAPRHHRLQIFEANLFLVTKLAFCWCQTCAEHRRTAATVKCIYKLLIWLIISDQSHLKDFAKQMTIFLWQWGTFITDTIF